MFRRLLGRIRAVDSVEAVVASVDYADLLEHTLPRNLGQLDDLVVVTSEVDDATRDTCRRHGVRAVTTDAFFEGGAPFNKGRGLNVGLGHLSRRGWILVLDADIVLTPDFRARVADRPLDTHTLHGAVRRTCWTPAAWRRYASGALRLEEIPADPLVYRHRKLLPCGYFHLFHPGARALRAHAAVYPEEFPTASKVDTVFAKRFRRRALLPLSVVHLGMPRANWRGRVTPRFELDDEAGAADRG